MPLPTEPVNNLSGVVDWPAALARAKAKLNDMNLNRFGYGARIQPYGFRRPWPVNSRGLWATRSDALDRLICDDPFELSENDYPVSSSEYGDWVL
jgi:hypothetical protein